MSQVREGELPEQLPDEPPEWSGPPEWQGGSEITESELAFVMLRRSANDYAKILDALSLGGGITVVPDPAPEVDPEPPTEPEPEPEA